MLRCLRRQPGRFVACGIALLCYFVVISKTGLISFAYVQQRETLDNPSVKERAILFTIPEYKDSLSLKEVSKLMHDAVVSHDERTSNTNEADNKQQTLRFHQDQNLSIKTNPDFCSDFKLSRRQAMEYPKASIVISFINVVGHEAVRLLSRILRHTPNRFTDDVIITADNSMKSFDKDILEQAADICSICRLFFFDGTIYQHRNAAARFSHSPILVFVDARVEVSDNWLEPLVFELSFNPTSVVSPQMRLRRKSYGDVSEGFTRLGLTWDLEVVRIPLSHDQARLVQENKVISVNQTAILKELFAVRKDHFLDLDLFDIFSPSSGGEHVSLSLKINNCGGNIITSLCSQIFMDVPETMSVLAYPRDYRSVTFEVPRENSTLYYEFNTKLWLDAYSSHIFHSSIHRQKNQSKTSLRHPYNPSFSKLSKKTNQFRSKLKSMECDTTNYRYILTKYQPEMVYLDRKTQQHGYIRNLDGIYAFGIDSGTSLPSDILSFRYSIDTAKRSNRGESPKWPQLILTRNSSQWVGPFSYSQGVIKYNSRWCVTAVVNNINNDNNNSNLVLQPCRLGLPTQLFIFKNNIVRWGGDGAKMCVTPVIGGEENGEGPKVSHRLVLTSCLRLEKKRMSGFTHSGLDFLKIDVEFGEVKT